MTAPADDWALLREALDHEAPAQQALIAGDAETAADGFTAAADAYRRSWEAAGPRAFGRLIGMLKATVLSGRDASAAAAYVREQVPEPDSPPSWYARGIAAAVEGDMETLRAAADGMRGASDAFERAATAMRALADGDREAFAAAVSAIEADFGAREEHLTGVPIADTALMLERLAAQAA